MAVRTKEITRVVTDPDELESLIKQYREGIDIAEKAIADLRKAVNKWEDKIQEYRKTGQITITEVIKS